MALSRRAQMHANEIRNHDWSDAPYRADRAGHDRAVDRTTTDQLTPDQTDTLRLNVMWTTAQVLAYDDPNFDVYEFAEACGISTRTKSGRKNGGIAAGLRTVKGRYCAPGTWDVDELFEPIQIQLAGRDITNLSIVVQNLGGKVAMSGWGNHYSMAIFFMPRKAEAAATCRDLIRAWEATTLS